MKNILLPVDFSDTATNAARYAAALAKDIRANKIILYNAYQQAVTADPMTTTEPMLSPLNYIDMDELAEASRNHLEKFKKTIDTPSGDGITIEVISEYNLLLDGVREVCASQAIDLVVMGITHADGFTEALVGSNAIDVARHITTPVLIVPQAAAYTSISQVLFAFDNKETATNASVDFIKQFIEAANAQLHVVHVEAGNANNTSQTNEPLQLQLKNIPAQYYTIHNNNFTEAISHFAAENSIHIIVAIPRRHGFFQNLFHKSHVKMLAFNSVIPLLLVHED